MKCRYCGKENIEGASFCAGCGKSLEEGFAPVGTGSISSPNNIVPSLPPRPPKKDAGKTRVIVALAVCLVTIFVTLLVVYKLARTSGEGSNSEASSVEDPNENQKERLSILLGEFTTVREWFHNRTEHLEQIELSDAESTKIRDLDSRLGRISENDTEAQLEFIDTVNQFVEDVNANHDIKESYYVPEFTPTPTVPGTSAITCLLHVEKCDMSGYPCNKVYLSVREKSTSQDVASLTKNDFKCTWTKFSGTAWVLTDVSYDNSMGQYILTLQSDSTEAAEDMMGDREICIELESSSFNGQCTYSFIPGNLLINDLLSAYLNAYIEDANSHTFNIMLNYIETNVDENDHYTLFYQMRKEVSGGFVRSLYQELKDYHINDVEVYDSQTLHISTRETYDGQYEMRYSEWKQEGLNIAESIPTFTGQINGDPSVVVWAHVTQHPEYLVRKNDNGEWKFHSYTGDLSLNQNWSVYNASIS